MRPLNPSLYAALISAFGTVDVRNEGQTASRNDGFFDTFGTAHDPAPHRAADPAPAFRSGETYRVPCPFCDDPGEPLFVNHRWGGPDPETGRPDLRLAECLNGLAPGGTDCLAVPGRREALYELVFRPVGPEDSSAATAPCPTGSTSRTT